MAPGTRAATLSGVTETSSWIARPTRPPTPVLAPARAEGLVLAASRGQLAADPVTSWLDVLGKGLEKGLFLVVATERSPTSRAVADGASRLREGAGCLVLEDARGEAAAEWLWAHGIGPEGTAWLEGGLPSLRSALAAQLVLRAEGALPTPTAAEAWAVRLPGRDPLRERVDASLVALCDGRLGTRGDVAAGRTRGDAAVHMSGVYHDHGAESHLLMGPLWQSLATFGDGWQRTLDLRTGVLHHHGPAGEHNAMLFSCATRPGTGVLRCRRAAGDPGPPLQAPAGSRARAQRVGSASWMRIGGDPGSIVAAAEQQQRPASHDRIAAYAGVAEGPAPEQLAIGPLREATRVGFDRLLNEHRRAWAQRWADCDVRLKGAPELQRAVRFALFHLLCAAPESGEAAVGARGLTGRAYRGHVFWDTDVYVLPFLAATRPAAARALLEYRIRRLPAAIRAARAQHGAGARFPWESAASGREVTPARVRDPRGELVPVLTGQREEHIVGDIAWAAACYIDWTGDTAFAQGAGGELITQAARWWASRIERDAPSGLGHIRGVMGPDEYHEVVDDNAFTNALAAWNLRRAIATGTLEDDERTAFAELADSLVDGFDPATGVYEQFDGFHELEPMIIADLAPRRPINADLLLGADTVRRAQVIKQADALMIHYLLPDAARPGSLAAGLRFYEPRTAHGSTLSPGVHAALLARAGRRDEAAAMLELTARIDLDDIGGTTAGGLHLAAMGSVWRALSFGFAGVRPRGRVLEVDPGLAGGWEALEVRVRFRASRIVLTIEPGRLRVRASPPTRIALAGAPPVTVGEQTVTMTIDRRDER